MSASVPAPLPPAPPVDPVLLGRCAELLVLAVGGGSGPPMLVHLRGTDDGIELDIGPAAGGDIGDALAGTTVPVDWHGLGCLVSGRARSLGDPHAGSTPGRVLGDAVSALLVWRDGTAASCLSIDGGEPRVQIDPPDGARGHECAGRIADALRRGLGLPTPAPPASMGDLGVRMWLHRLHATAVVGTPVGVATVDALAPPLPTTWEACREQAAQGAWPELGIPPHLAGWMDDGMFAREALGAFPDPIELLEHLADLLAPEVWQHLIAALAALDRPTSY
jgi:hypothetical protein